MYSVESTTSIFYNRSIWSIEGTQADTTSPSQDKPWSNCNEGILHTPNISRNEDSPLDSVKCHTQDRKHQKRNRINKYTYFLSKYLAENILLKQRSSNICSAKIRKFFSYFLSFFFLTRDKTSWWRWTGPAE